LDCDAPSRPRVRAHRMSIGARLHQFADRFAWPLFHRQPEHLKRGASGESLACRHLHRLGYKILYRNFRGRTGGELDIVCRDRDTLVFVEVKTRTGEDFGRPFEAVRPDQQHRISRGALAWLRMLDNPDILFRFDVVEVVLCEGAKPRIELIRNAFSLSEPYVY
ncbi:MAG TPA: YraN family protein, partial [Chthoniobacterales bacterium]|nr:YraN family protein [Chthoniobacterales bacterium]